MTPKRGRRLYRLKAPLVALATGLLLSGCGAKMEEALKADTTEESAKRTPILSVRLASDLPEAERPAFEFLSTEGEPFARYAEARANRRDPFFIHPAGGADICNIPVPVRRVAD